MSISSLASEIVANERALSPQQAVTWYPRAWRSALAGWDDYHAALERVIAASDEQAGNYRLSRDGVRKASSIGDPLTTFLASQVWGYGDRGYGPHRVCHTVLCLTDTSSRDLRDEVVRRLTVAHQKCQTDGGVEAYRYLVNEGRIAGLGPSFLTKFLYFVPNAASPSPLVLDAVVRRVIEHHARERLRRRFGNTEYYEDYLGLVDDLVSSLADEYGIIRRPEDVEAALFSVGKSA